MVDHVISSMNEVVSYDYSSTHQALDIVGENNTSSDIIAISDGVVEMVVNNVKYTNHKTKGTATYGNFIKIRHDNGKKTLYAHLKYGSVSAKIGDKITKGEKIGTMGATGNAYGTHLHFEVRSANETRENPKDYLYGQATFESLTETVENEKTDNTLSQNNIDSNASKNVVEKADNTNTQENKATQDTQKSGQTTNDKVANTNVETKNNNYSNNRLYNGGSIVDALKSVNIDSSFDNREIIAIKNGIDNYRGSYEQNVYLLYLFKQGKLKTQ